MITLWIFRVMSAERREGGFEKDAALSPCEIFLKLPSHPGKGFVFRTSVIWFETYRNSLKLYLSILLMVLSC